MYEIILFNCFIDLCDGDDMYKMLLPLINGTGAYKESIADDIWVGTHKCPVG